MNPSTRSIEHLNHPSAAQRSDQSQHVTAVITHRVKTGRQEGYEEWIKGIAAAAREFEGHLGVSIFRPQTGSSDYVLVLRFNACSNLTAWLQSETRKAWINQAQPLIQEQEKVQILTGLESWFDLPTQPTHTPPKRYKQATLVWVGVMTVSLCVGPLLTPLISGLPWVLQAAVRAGITVSLLSYVIMPRLTQWLKGWLFA